MIAMYMNLYSVYTSPRREPAMSTARHKHIVLDQGKLDRARKELKTRTDRETVERALDIVLDDAELDRLLRRAGGKSTIRKVFR